MNALASLEAFGASDATLGDTVLVREEEGHWWFERLLRPSRNSLVRVVFLERGCVERLSARLIVLGCATEYLEAHNLLAVNVPDTSTLIEVQGYLAAEASAGSIDYEEPILRQ